MIYVNNFINKIGNSVPTHKTISKTRVTRSNFKKFEPKKTHKKEKIREKSNSSIN